MFQKGGDQKEVHSRTGSLLARPAEHSECERSRERLPVEADQIEGLLLNKSIKSPNMTGDAALHWTEVTSATSAEQLVDIASIHVLYAVSLLADKNCESARWRCKCCVLSARDSCKVA
jgi:hypothetical protein